MNPEVFAAWLRRQGHTVVRTSSTYWFDQGPRVYQAFPFHRLIEPSRAELRKFILEHHPVGLRYSAPVSSVEGTGSYHVVLEDTRYGLDVLGKKARYDVRKGLANASIEPIAFPFLASAGWSLRRDTLARQGRTGAESEGWWRRLCLSAQGLPGFEAWGAMCEGTLVASLLAFTADGCCSILYQQSATACLKKSVNNALTFVFATEALSRPDVSMIFYGLHSLDAPSSVDEYKFRMGFRAKPVRQRVVFHPAIAPLFNAGSHAALAWLRRRFRVNSTLAKAEGMVRFYRQGKLPLSRQTLPNALSGLELG